MIVATAGHVDHGKTTLIRALTGIETDRLKIEKERGLSIELGFAYQDRGDGEIVGFVDVPGHSRFLPTMLAGVGGIDAALLIVAADDGVMPQTREHLAILDFLGIERGIAVITKCDAVAADRPAEVGRDVAALLAGTKLAGAPVLAVDSLSRRGIDALKTALLALSRSNRSVDAPPRMAIDRAFHLKGIGLVATGTLLCGSLATGGKVCISPGGYEARIRSLHAQNRQVETARAGERCAVNLIGAAIDPATVRRGRWLVAPGGGSLTRRFDAAIRLGGDCTASGRRDLPVHLHIGTADVTARLVLLDQKSLEPGQSALAQIVTDADIDAVHGDRFILRDQGGTQTVAGGRVITPNGGRRGRARPMRLEGLRAAMAGDDPASVLTALLDLPPFSVDLAGFRRERNLTRRNIDALAARGEFKVFQARGVAFAINTEKWDRWRDRVPECLSVFHETWPHLIGPSPNDLRKLLREPRPEPPVFDALLTRLAESGDVAFHHGAIGLPGHRPTLPLADEALWSKAEAMLSSAGAQAPVVHEMARALSVEPAALTGVLDRAATVSLVVRISRNRFLPPATVDLFSTAVATLSGENPDGFPVTLFRDKAGIGRNLAIDVLEYFDRICVTVRKGDLRVMKNQPINP